MCMSCYCYDYVLKQNDYVNSEIIILLLFGSFADSKLTLYKA